MSNEGPSFFGDNDEYSNKEANGSTDESNNDNSNTDKYDLNYFTTKKPADFVVDINQSKSPKKTNKNTKKTNTKKTNSKKGKKKSGKA
jgi:hypothetical protein